MKRFSLGFLVYCLGLFAVAGSVAGQGGDGFTAQETPGIALVKPQAWSKESEATVMEFTAFTDRRAQGSATGGYIEFRTKAGQTRQIDAARIFRVVVYPDPDRVSNLLEDEDRQRVANLLSDLAAVVQRFPATRPYLEGPARSLNEMLQRFDAGEVKIEGEWVTQRAHQEGQANQLAELLRREIDRAEPASSFELDEDAKFGILKNLGRTLPKARTLAQELQTRHTARLHAEKRVQILEKLTNPALSIEECRKLVAELNALSPGDDPAAKEELDRWERADREAVALEQAAEPLADQVEARVAAIGDYSAPPVLGAEVTNATDSLVRRFRAFRQSSPPPQIAREAERAEAVSVVVEGFGQLPALFDERRFLDAKTILDTMAPRTAKIGPETTKAVSELQKMSTSRIEQFSRAREEARSHAEAGRTEEAMAKYQEALEIMPDAAVSRSLDELRTPSDS